VTTVKFSDAFSGYLLAQQARRVSGNYLALLALSRDYWTTHVGDDELAAITPDHIRRWLLWLGAGDGKGLAALNALRGRIDQLGDIELRPAPLLNGHALARLGAVAGPELGQLAQEMYIAQLEGELQTGEEAERWVRKWLIRHRESQE